MAGTTTSPDFPLSNALQTQNGPYGAGFIVKLSPDGKTILYSTYFGGLTGSTTINAMTTDVAGNLYLTGTTLATDFPHTSGMPSAVVAQNANVPLASPLRSMRRGNVYFGGNTNTTNLPATPGAFLTQGIGAFAGKIAANGTGLAYLTLIGSASELASGPLSTGATVLSSLTADSAGNAYLAGNTGDPKFPVTTGAFQTAFAGGPVNTFGVPANTDGFVAKTKPRRKRVGMGHLPRRRG